MSVSLRVDSYLPIPLIACHTSDTTGAPTLGMYLSLVS